MFFFEELKDEFQEILSITDFTPKHLKHEKIGPRRIQAYGKLRAEKSSTDGYFITIMVYIGSEFRDFKSYLRNFVGLDEDNIQLILKQNVSILVTHEVPPGI